MPDKNKPLVEQKVKSLKEQHLEAITEEMFVKELKGSIVQDGHNKAAEACSAISEAAQDGFADWIADNHWHRRNKVSWYQHICPDYLTTAELRRLYNRTQNK
jgi:hypothetical protein